MQPLNEVKRYNRGFYKFGPLEHCESGELVFVNDIEPVILDICIELENCRSEVEEDRICTNNLMRKNDDLKITLTHFENIYRQIKISRNNWIWCFWGAVLSNIFALALLIRMVLEK